MNQESFKAASKVDAESMAAGRAMKPRPDDVFIVTSGKCGTTWLSQICHCLRSRGDMNFKNLNDVVPWNIFMKLNGLEFDEDHKHSPRCFKVHDVFKNTPQKRASGKLNAKYVVVCRDPLKASLSAYNFLPELSAGYSYLEFTRRFFECFDENSMLFQANWTEIYLSWFQATKDHKDEIQWVFYEDMIANPETEIQRLARFMDIELDEELLQITLEKSSRKFMLENLEKFEDQIPVTSGLPNSKVQKVKAEVKNSPDKEEELADLNKYLEKTLKERLKVIDCSGYLDFKEKVKNLYTA